MGPLVRDDGARPDERRRGLRADCSSELGADSIAAFFAEPIVGAGGVVPPADGYFEAVQRICRDNDILFVADEVITRLRPHGRAGSARTASASSRT